MPLMIRANAIMEFDRRKSERTEADEVAFISVGGSSTRCRVVSISSDGAAIDVLDAHHIPNRFRLMTERDRVVRHCRVVWIRENRIGVQFEETVAVAVFEVIGSFCSIEAADDTARS